MAQHCSILMSIFPGITLRHKWANVKSVVNMKKTIWRRPLSGDTLSQIPFCCITLACLQRANKSNILFNTIPQPTTSSSFPYSMSSAMSPFYAWFYAMHRQHASIRDIFIHEWKNAFLFFAFLHTRASVSFCDVGFSFSTDFTTHSLPGVSFAVFSAQRHIIEAVWRAACQGPGLYRSANDASSWASYIFARDAQPRAVNMTCWLTC